jgi:glycosyltransferase involved in cell wall biosynthesis
MKLSAAIITYNEERNIERCLLSLKGIADEIVVVDSFSTDRTKEICLNQNVIFIPHVFEGHIQQKNYAMDCTSGDWVISLDADEALSDELRTSILGIKNKPDSDGYEMNRLTNYCGHWVRHCGWYPDTKVRLIKKGKARWMGVNPHDRLDILESGSKGKLQGDILHYSYYTKEDHLKQIEFFGKISSGELFRQGKKSSWPLIVIKVLAQFIKSYFIKLGILDGATGLTISRLSAYATYRKYKMLIDLHANKNGK